MDENEIQRKRRDNEEQATRNRARILGLPISTRVNLKTLSRWFLMYLMLKPCVRIL